MENSLLYDTGGETFRLDAVDYVSEVYEKSNDLFKYGIIGLDLPASMFCWKLYLSSGRKIVFGVDIPEGVPCGREWAEIRANYERTKFVSEWKEYLDEL